MLYTSKPSTTLWVSILASLALILFIPDYGLAQEPANRKYYIILEGRLAYAKGDETTYAELHDMNMGRFVTSNGVIDTYEVELDSGWSGKIGFGMHLSPKWDINLCYTGLTIDGDDETGNVGYGTYYSTAAQWLFPVLGGYPSYYFSAKAEADTTYHVIDFEAGYNTKLGDADLRLSAGIRYANFDQDVDTTFYFPGYFTSESRDVDFWGIGPRIGMGVSVPLGSTNFFVTGRVNGAVLFGDNDSETKQTGTLPGANNKFSDSSGREVYNIDGELGLGYDIKVNPDFQALVIMGYRAEAWYNINDTSSNVTISGINYGSRHDDQIFYGPFLRTEFRF